MNELINDILKKNRDQFLEINNSKLSNMFGKTFIKNLKEDFNNMKHIPVSMVSENKSFIANMVSKINDYNNLKDERLNYFIRLYKIDEDYITNLINEDLFKAIVDNINDIEKEYLHLLKIGNYKTTIILLNSEKLNVSKIEFEMMDEMLIYILDEIEKIEFNLLEPEIQNIYFKPLSKFITNVLNKLMEGYEEYKRDIPVSFITIESSVIYIMKRAKCIDEYNLKNRNYKPMLLNHFKESDISYRIIKNKLNKE